MEKHLFYVENVWKEKEKRMEKTEPKKGRKKILYKIK